LVIFTVRNASATSRLVDSAANSVFSLDQVDDPLLAVGNPSCIEESVQ